MLKPARWAPSVGLVSPSWRWVWGGLRHLWIPDGSEGHIHDYVGGFPVKYTAVAADTEVSYGERGLGLYNDVLNPGIDTVSVPPYATTEVSVLAVFRNDITDGSQDCLIGHQSSTGSTFSWMFRHDASGVLKWRTINNSGNDVDCDLTGYLSTVGERTVMGTWKNGHSEVFADGVFVTSGDHSSSIQLRQPGTPQPLSVMDGSETANRGFVGLGYLFAVWHRAFSREEAEVITRDPFGFIRPAGTLILTPTGLVYQYFRPDGDLATSGWDTAPTASQSLYAQLDEEDPSDTDYIYPVGA